MRDKAVENDANKLDSEPATTTTISSASDQPTNGANFNSQEDEYVCRTPHVLPSKAEPSLSFSCSPAGVNSSSCAATANSSNNGGYARSRLFRAAHEVLLPSNADDFFIADGTGSGSLGNCFGPSSGGLGLSWQLFSVTLHRAHPNGFGIAISGGRDNPNFVSGDPSLNESIIVSDVIASGPAFGLVQINDRIVSANGLCLENADYAMAVAVMKDADQLNMIVKRRVPVPFVEFEQRTLKFTLSKSRKKDDFGIVLGCKFFIKEITNPRLAEKEPGLKEGDTVLRVNGQTLDGVTLEEAARLLHRSREKLSLVVQRDVRRGSAGSRWPSQTTVYERLGSVSATPRHSPTPVHYTHSATGSCGNAAGDSTMMPPPSSSLQHGARNKFSDYSPGPKRFSDPMSSSRVESSDYQVQGNNSPQPFPNPSAYYPNNGVGGRQGESSSPLFKKKAFKFTDSEGQSPQAFQHSNHPAQSQTPSSSIISASSAAGSPRNFPPTTSSTGSTNTTMANYAYYNQQLPQAQPAREIRSVSFNKGSGSLGIRVIGGNQVGIFVSAVQEGWFGISSCVENILDSHHLRMGDRIHSVGGQGNLCQSMTGATREQAVEYLLALSDEVTVKVEHNQEEFSHISGGQLGDSFYISEIFEFAQKLSQPVLSIGQSVDGSADRNAFFFFRTHFSYQKRSSNRQELNFQAGDIFHVTDTLCGGKSGYWQVTKVYSVNESDAKSSNDTANGIIPNSKTAEVLAKQARMDSSTLGRSIFRKRLQSRRTKSMTTTVAEDEFLSGLNATGSSNFTDIPLPAYERVSLKKPAFHRPVVLYGPLADVARQLLLSNFGPRFGAAFDYQNVNESQALVDNSQQRIIRMSSIDTVMASQRHCVLSISPGSVERLQLAQYAPIVVLIDVDSRNRIRDLRSKSGATTLSARKLMEQASKVKKHHAHLLTATLDASKEDGWFEALRHLIFHLQERRVWMPEFQPTQPIEDLLLFPMQNCNIAETPDGDSSKGDYGIYDATASGASVQGTPAHRLSNNEQQDVGAGGYAGSTNASGSSLERLAVNSARGGGGSNSPFFTAFARSSPYSHSYRNVYGNTPTTVASNYGGAYGQGAPQTDSMISRSGTGRSESGVTGYYDVKQILAEHYPNNAAYAVDQQRTTRSRLSASSPYQQPMPSPRQSLQQSFSGNNRFSGGLGAEHQQTVSNISGSRSPDRSGSQMGGSIGDMSKTLTYDAPYIDDAKHHLNLSPSKFSNPSSEDYANNNNELPSTASATVNFSLSANKPLHHHVGSDSPAMLQTTSSSNGMDPIVIEHVHGLIDWKGGSLKCPESGVELIVPESAIPFGCQQELFVKVCRENHHNPPLDVDKQEALMSPLVMCGPQGVRFEVPVELKLPHDSMATTSSNFTNNQLDGGGNSVGSPTSFVLKSGSGANWRNIELVRPPKRNHPADKFVSVLVSHF